jgi:zinc resistance-associated protein
MMRHILPSLAALAVCAFAFAAQAAPDESSGSMGMERMQNWAADHEALLDAGLAGLKAGLKLTPDQDKLWQPFETSVREAAKLRMDQMTSMMGRMEKMREMMQSMQETEDTRDMDAEPAVSPIDRLEAMGKRMSERGAAIQKVADAGKPLYASLDDSQKRRFVMLGRALFMMGHGHHGMGMMSGMGMMGGEMMRHGGMGMMGQMPDGMGKMGRGPKDEEDDSGDE